MLCYLQGYLPVREDTLCRIQDYTHEDAFKVQANVIKQGWPEGNLQNYFLFKNELTVKNGIIFKGDRVLTPFHPREEQEIRLHSIHVRIQSCKRRAMKAFYIRFKRYLT